MKRIAFMFTVVTALILSSCTGRNNEVKEPCSINAHIADLVAEVYADRTDRPEDFILNQVIYGSFSGTDRNEMLVLCKMLHMPHIAGKDNTFGVIMDADSLEVVTYREFASDDVSISCLPGSDGQERIMYIGISTYQGVHSQIVQFLKIEDGIWKSQPLECLESEGDNQAWFWYMTGNRLILSDEYPLADLAEILDIYVWNVDLGQFVTN